MTEELQDREDGLDMEHPKIYSSRAIWGFTIFFTTIFGGVLLMQNLRDVNRKREANLVLLYSALFTIISIYLVNIPERPTTNIAMIFNFIGGGVLSYYAKNKYFPDEAALPKKTIWKPLIISLLITIPFVWAMIYSA